MSRQPVSIQANVLIAGCAEGSALVLDETLSRILSVAVIHEFLSYKDTNIINIKDVSNRIAAQLREGVLDPNKKIKAPVTYQDPCNVSRNGGLWEEARKIIPYIADDFRDMPPPPPQQWL